MAGVAQLDWLDVSRETLRRQRSTLITDTPRARTSDPETSHAAAEEVRSSGRLGRQQREVLEAVQRWPGCTSAELAQQMAAVRGCHWTEVRWMVARRLPELEPHRVKKGEARECRMTRRKAHAWSPA